MEKGGRRGKRMGEMKVMEHGNRSDKTLAFGKAGPEID